MDSTFRLWESLLEDAAAHIWVFGLKNQSILYEVVYDESIL
jgi:hypothetical protein